VLYEQLTSHPKRAPHERGSWLTNGGAARLAEWHLGQAGRGPDGGRRCGHRLLAGLPPQGPAARRADRRGGAGAVAAGHDLPLDLGDQQDRHLATTSPEMTSTHPLGGEEVCSLLVALVWYGQDGLS
jgi:hypothetical protein